MRGERPTVDEVIKYVLVGFFFTFFLSYFALFLCCTLIGIPWGVRLFRFATTPFVEWAPREPRKNKKQATKASTPTLEWATGGPNQVTNWREAEENAAAWMRRWGFADARVTTTGPDGGIDVVSASAVAQVKFEAQQSGRPYIQNLIGAAVPFGNRQRLFFTGSSYSRAALDYAAETGAALFTYRLDGSVTAANRHGEQLLRTAQPFEAIEVQPDAQTVVSKPVVKTHIKPERAPAMWATLAIITAMVVIQSVIMLFLPDSGGTSLIASVGGCLLLTVFFYRQARIAWLALEPANRGGSTPVDAPRGDDAGGSWEVYTPPNEPWGSTA